MTPCRELLAFAVVLAALAAGFLGESLFGGKVLSPADVLRASASIGGASGDEYEPANRLLIDPVLQFQPWLEFNRAMLRSGRLPLWNPYAGCGAPHLANGQSAVFDPFHALAYLGSLPQAYGWMAAARLWVAGVGMFLLARFWRFGPWGRWFAGLAFPFCGFLVVWLLYPVASVAVWMPWLFWASDRVLRAPRARAVGTLALIVGCVLLGGHIQTSAHVLMAVGLSVCWGICGVPGQLGRRLRPPHPGPLPPGQRETKNPLFLGAGEARPSLPLGGGKSRPCLCLSGSGPGWGGRMGWLAGMLLGLALGAIAYVPLAFYLTRSPVWSDREAERPGFGTLARPRLLDMACTALPYLYGSQRRGHPNLAKALGVHNLNESAGGFAGLATLIWLAPLAWSARRRQPRVRFLAALVILGALGAFRWPPLDSLLRALPVLNVIDHRRLTLWVAFGLVALGGIGLDHLAAVRRGRAWGRWACVWAWAGVGLVGVAAQVGRFEPWLRARAAAHYARASATTLGAREAAFHARAERQVRQTVSFVPRYLTIASAHLLGLAFWMMAVRRGVLGARLARAGLLGVTLLDLLGFGFGLNPAIARKDDRPESPLTSYLRREVGPRARILALGAELPPNSLMRYGLADPRDYDSVELTRILDWLEPLYERVPGRSARTSRRPITWAGVLRARDRLREARVAAIVSPTPPPPGQFERVDRLGDLWIARLPVPPWTGLASGLAATVTAQEPGVVSCRVHPRATDRLVVRETFDPGWRAEVDGRPAPVEPYRGTFLAVPLAKGEHVVTLRYDPAEVRGATWISRLGLLVVLAALAIPRWMGARIGQKMPQTAWTEPSRRVTIKPVISTGPPFRSFTEG